MSPALAIVLAALAVATPPSTRGPNAPASAAQDPDPAVRAGELFRLGEFEQAAMAFEAAYARTGDPALLFGRAQSLRRAGNCGAAIEVFEAFIATSPPAADVQAANDVIAACRSILGEDASEPEAEPPAPEPAPVADDPAPPAPRWSRDVAGGVLLGSGLAVTIAGAAIVGTAFARAGDERRETEMAYEDRQQSTRTLAAAGTGLMVGGTALLVGSVVRYVIVARRDGARPRSARRERPRGDVARRRIPLARPVLVR